MGRPAPPPTQTRTTNTHVRRANGSPQFEPCSMFTEQCGSISDATRHAKEVQSLIRQADPPRCANFSLADTIQVWACTAAWSMPRVSML